MDFKKLLQPFSCDCGMEHRCAISAVEIGFGALQTIPNLTEPYRHILVVADENTYGVCGGAVETLLGLRRGKTFVFPGKNLLVPNEEAVARLQAQLEPDTDLLLGIGSGVIQDLCKYVSFQANLPYQIVATAPSMDGYASKGAAMIMENMKITYNAHVPEAIVGDLDILKDAPMELIKSGYGDILGKYSCLNDWKLSALVRGEHFCQKIYDMVYDMLLQTKDLGPKLLSRDPEAIGTLMEALVVVGIAMALVGSSRPASGSEHHLSHYFEVTGLLNNEAYFMHGIDVAYSAVITQRLREELMSLKQPLPKGLQARAGWEGDIKTIYTHAAEGIIALQDGLGWYAQDRMTVYEEKWEEIRAVLQEVPSSETLAAYLKSAGLDMAEFDGAYAAEKVENGIFYAKDLKDRYSVLWLYYDLMR